MVATLRDAWRRLSRLTSKSGSSGQRRRAGIRARLFCAFAAVAGSTVVAGVAASLLFSQIGGLLRDVAERNIPEVAGTLSLAANSEALRAIAPSLLAADTAPERDAQLKSLAAAQAAITKQLEALGSAEADRDAVAKIGDQVGLLKSKLTALGAAINERQTMTAAKRKSLQDLRTAQAALLDKLHPLLAEARGAVATALKQPGDDAAAALSHVAELAAHADAPADLAATVEFAVGILANAASLPDDPSITAAQTDFTPLAEKIAEMAKPFGAEGAPASFGPALDDVLDFGTGAQTVFELRRQELAAQKSARKILDDANAITAELKSSVAERVAAVGVKTDAAIRRSDAAIATGRLIMIAIAAVSVVAAFLFVWLYIGRNLVARIVGLAQVMQRIAEGDLTADVETAARHADEIGRMAGALAVFRDGIVRADALAAEKATEQRAGQQRAATIEAATREFNAGATGALAAVSGATADMQGTAERMSAVAHQASAETEAVAAAAGQAAVNVQTVAAATTGLSSSIKEIGGRVAESARIAEQAVNRVALSRDTVHELSRAAQQIGEVVGLINAIAGQTNLLALNATIEAARAGEAGKGFAVVASEVKSLATQTAKATEEISAQVNAIQSSTRQAVDAIKGVGEIIGRMSEIATIVTAAVEEQGTTTLGIAHNIQEAAAGTQEVSTHIADLSQVAGAAGKSAEEVLAAITRLTRESEGLRGEVDRFLGHIKAA
jgi:methyl-accepting chemotaxis protein